MIDVLLIFTLRFVDKAHIWTCFLFWYKNKFSLEMVFGELLLIGIIKFITIYFRLIILNVEWVGSKKIYTIWSKNDLDFIFTSYSV